MKSPTAWSKPRVALVFPAQSDHSHSLIAGIGQELDRDPAFSPTVIFYVDSDALRIIENLSEFDGMITFAGWDMPLIAPALNSNLAVINCGTDWLTESRILSLYVDQKIAIRPALEHFQSAGLASAFFISHELEGRAAALKKALAFCEQAEASGMETGYFEIPGEPIQDKPTRLARFSREKQVARLIAKIPKPAGLFCEDDAAALMMCGVAEWKGTGIPKDLAVLGYGNQLAGRFGPIPISSFPIGGERIGIEAVRFMKTWLETARRPPSPEPLSPLPIIVRESTGGDAHDPYLEGARRLIAREACSGLKAKEVADRAKVNRKTLTQRYVQAFGETPSEAIRRTRFEKAQQLLKSPDFQSVAKVSAKCGFSSLTSFSNFFQRQAGVAPIEFRQQGD